MKFIINETGEERELHFYHPSSPEDMADDLIGNSGAVGDYIKSIPATTSTASPRRITSGGRSTWRWPAAGRIS